jgi:hypothetical protein
MTSSTADCRRHRLALAELAERDEPTRDGLAALLHVERCRDCADVLGDLTLTVIALRRLGSDAGRRELAIDALRPDAWTRLRDGIERSRRLAREQAWRWRTSILGLLTAAFVTAALVGPATVSVAQTTGGDWVSSSGPQLDALSWRIEADYVSSAHALPPGGLDPISASDPTAFRRYPDALQPPRKEVRPAGGSVPKPSAT